MQPYGELPLLQRWLHVGRECHPQHAAICGLIVYTATYTTLVVLAGNCSSHSMACLKSIVMCCVVQHCQMPEGCAGCLVLTNTKSKHAGSCARLFPVRVPAAVPVCLLQCVSALVCSRVLYGFCGVHHLSCCWSMCCSAQAATDAAGLLHVHSPGCGGLQSSRVLSGAPHDGVCASHLFRD